MPAIFTHYLFAKNHLDKDEKYQEAYILASQGPDPLFFFGQLPWARKGRDNRLDINKLGIGLHHEDITDFYVEMIHYARESNDKDLLFSFIKGFFLHYALDRNCHPYVFAKTGFSDDPVLKKFYASCHTKTESAIDMLLGQKDGSWNEDTSIALQIDDTELMKISEMIYVANSRSDKYPSIQKDSYFKSVHDYKKVMKFVNVPHYFKRLFVTFFGKESMAYSLNYPRNLKKTYGDIDFLNEKHSAWPSLVTGEKRHESFLDLENTAYEDYLKVMPLLEEEFKGNDKKEEIRAWVGSITHDGIKLDEEMKYMEPFFSK